MSISLLTYREHDEASFTGESVPLSRDLYEITFQKTHRGKEINLPCYTIKRSIDDPSVYSLTTSYFIGVDWLEANKSALHIAPKLNDENKEVDFIKMLLSSLRHPDITEGLNDLFEIKWDQPRIKIEQQQDLLTPFLVVEFLGLLKTIVRKGLKKSYYKVEKNLHSRVKGKILVGKSLKHNLYQNRKLQTFCRYDEFGLNNKENKLLKKALNFVKRYITGYARLTNHRDLQDTFNYIQPAFQKVSDRIDLNEIKHVKTNAFYAEYEHALRMAKLILKRFGYNITNAEKDTIETPPFWIDMSKLFELYALGVLKDRFQKKVKFQYKYYGNELDYLLNTDEYSMVVDAKYKLKYITGKYDQDIRQVSGYARLKNVYKELGKERGDIIDCLIIYPDQENGIDNLEDVDLKRTELKHYYDVYKLGLKLPLVG